MSNNAEHKLKPVPRRVAEIVGRLAEAKVVEGLIQNVTHSTQIRGNLADLSQIIYFALLQTDPARMEHLNTFPREMRFYIVRMIQNQYYSMNSPFYNENRKFSRRTCEISNQISETYATGKDGTRHR